MPTLSITWRTPGQRVRIVITVVIYIIVIRFAPHQAIPVILGSLLGPVVAAKSHRGTRRLSIPEDER